ncbi:MAG: hypothetical protein NVSMB66_7270 [Candidatus Doudnabacteria bacterium]
MSEFNEYQNEQEEKISQLNQTLLDYGLNLQSLEGKKVFAALDSSSSETLNDLRVLLNLDLKVRTFIINGKVAHPIDTEESLEQYDLIIDGLGLEEQNSISKGNIFLQMKPGAEYRTTKWVDLSELKLYSKGPSDELKPEHIKAAIAGYTKDLSQKYSDLGTIKIANFLSEIEPEFVNDTGTVSLTVIFTRK